MVETLARGEGQMATAKLAGCSVSTVRRRLEDPQFCRRVDRFRESMLERSAGRLNSLNEKAILTLERLLDAENPPAVQLSAARSIVEFTFRVREILSIEKRLAEVEAAMKAQQDESNLKVGHC